MWRPRHAVRQVWQACGARQTNPSRKGKHTPITVFKCGQSCTLFAPSTGRCPRTSELTRNKRCNGKCSHIVSKRQTLPELWALVWHSQPKTRRYGERIQKPWEQKRYLESIVWQSWNYGYYPVNVAYGPVSASREWTSGDNEMQRDTSDTPEEKWTLSVCWMHLPTQDTSLPVPQTQLLIYRLPTWGDKFTKIISVQFPRQSGGPNTTPLHNTPAVWLWGRSSADTRELLMIPFLSRCCWYHFYHAFVSWI